MYYYILYGLAFLIGGNVYCLIELIYRSKTHYSMFFCAGLAVIIMLFIYRSNKAISPVIFGLIASLVITALEFIFGIVFNLFLNEKVWDYSNTPLNIMGQICLPFSVIWFFFGLLLLFIFKSVKI